MSDRVVQSSHIRNLSRRGFLKGLAGAGSFVLAAHVAPRWALAETMSSGQADPAFVPNVFVSVDTDGTVTIVTHRSEMGTGIRTSLPMVVAEEMDADWERVRIEQAIGDAKYGSQNTDGSRSIRDFYQTMRETGATARTMLVQAAALRWGVAADQCMARKHAVHHEASGRSLGFGELAEAAASLEIPTVESLVFKSSAERRYVGKQGHDLTDTSGYVTGKAVFGMDVQIDGMKYAAMARCPVLGGKIVSVDDAKARHVPGVIDVIQLETSGAPHGFKALGGVAVIANDTWAAFRGRDALKIEWDEGANASFDSAAFREALEQAVRKPGEVVRESGDVDAAMASAAHTVEAEYYLPMLAHAPMEPPSAVAHVTSDGCEAWVPTQNPQACQGQIAQDLGIDPSKVIVNVPLLGGGFGRKSKPDYAAEAALLSREVGAPIKVVWSREDDLRHGYYHACAAMSFRAGQDDRGRTQSWLQRSAFPTISSTFVAGADSPSGGELELGFVDVPYQIEHLRSEKGRASAHVRIGWFRSVCNVFHAFGVSSFTDELAHAVGRDPKDYLLELLGEDRIVDLSQMGVNYSNYGSPLDLYPIDTQRMRILVERVAKEAGWGRELPRGRGLGIALHRSFATYVAAVVEVDVARDGTVSVPRVDMAVDCGLAVNPDRVRSQMEGAAVFGTSLVRFGAITAKNGRVEQSNYHDYRMARIIDAPREVHVHIMENDAPPGGVGEPGVPPFAPAMCNAIFAATGKRVRSLPISEMDLSWS